MSLAAVKPEQYEQQLEAKKQWACDAFSEFSPPALDVFPSRPEHYRMRAEFRVWHEQERSYYRMFNPETKAPFEVTHFPAGSETIDRLMMPLMTDITANNLIRKRLFQIEYLTTQTGEALVSLIYHRQLDEAWAAEARQLQDKYGIHIIGRARKQKLVLEQDYVTEVLNVNGQRFQYTQYENSFTQPNAVINEKMLGWASLCSQEINRDGSSDLLELYCGNGNFTCVLAKQFNKVLATEISKTSVSSALQNFALNNVDNVHIARLSSEELTQAMNKERLFRRLSDIELDSYRFSTLLVDPPRAGLDKGTEALSQRFEHILYISCNPTTLKANLSELTKTHFIAKIALFDQFPYTHHAEMGVHLMRR